MSKAGLSKGSSAPARVEAGKALRKRMPRSSHAAWAPPTDRRDPISILEEQELTRLADLIPIRHGRMMASTFAFYRGTAAIMAADLATTPTTDLVVQACGDAHLANFGLYASPERNLVFDLNDFDETHPASFEWDLKRLTASVAICGRSNGFSESKTVEAVLETAGSYRRWIRRLAKQRYVDVWYARVDAEAVAALLKGKQQKRAHRGIKKAKTKTSLQAFNKLTKMVDGHPRIVDDPPLIQHRAEGAHLVAELNKHLEEYLKTVPESRRTLLRRYRTIDGARKVVGVGSVGTASGIVLTMGDRDDDPLFLQVKEADASVLEPYTARSRFSNHGHRVVHGQRLMQATSDIFLGWVTLRGRDAYVRQLRDMKGSPNLDDVTPRSLRMYAGMCGATLARAHARSGDALAIGAYLGKGDVFDRALAGFSLAYADQAKRDHAALVEAVRSGRMDAQEGI